jgi:hypothetical protein
LVRTELDWANLEALALDLILDKLEEQIDHICFGGVCKNWRLIAKLNHQNQRFKSHVLPMLMIPRTKRCLYSISAKKMYPFKLPNSYYHIYCGFSHGWLATIDKSHAITLLHPFKNVAPISLPTLDYRSYTSLPVVGYKVTLSADPITRPNDYMVVAIHTNIDGRFAFIKAGQSCWTYVWFSRWLHSFMDVMFYGGLVYAVSKYHSIVSFNPGHKRITPNPIQDIAFHGSSKGYLVKSLEGDLWIVKRFFTFKGDFQVYKLEFDVETGKFKKMLKLESLGDNVLFLGDTDSISASGSYFSGCLKKDSIYYIHGPFHIGIYNVRDGTFDHHTLHNHFFNKQDPQPFWVLPNFQWD